MFNQQSGNNHVLQSMQGSSNNSGMKPHQHQQQQQQTQPVRYPPQFYKLQKNTASVEPQQYQIHLAMPVVQQSQQITNMHASLLHQQQQQQQHQALQQQQQLQQQNIAAQTITMPDYQINNMFNKLSINDIQLQQQHTAHMAPMTGVLKPQPVNRKLFIKSNTTVHSGISSQNSNNNEMLAMNSHMLSNTIQNTENQNMNNATDAKNIPTLIQQNYQSHQSQQDSLFTRSFDNFDITNRFNQNEQQNQFNFQQQPQNYMQQTLTPQQQQQTLYRFNTQQQFPQQQFISQYPGQNSMTSSRQGNQINLSSDIQQTNSNRTSDVSINGDQTNRPQSALSYNQNQLSRSATSARRQQSAEPVAVDANHEVIISNIDRDTVGHIIHELHSHGVQDLNYKLIEQQIFIVKFKNKDSADWAIEKYDGQSINGMKLQVRQVIQEKQTRGRRTHFLPLTKINETNNDGDEDQISDGSNHSNKEDFDKYKTPQNQAPPSSQNQTTPDLSQIKMNMLAQQRATTPKIQGEGVTHGTASGFGSQNKYPANYKNQNLAISPNQSFSQGHNQNTIVQQSMQSRQGYNSGSKPEQFQNQTQASLNSQNQQIIYNGGINVAQNQQSFDQFGNIQSMHKSFYQQPTNPLLTKQMSTGQIAFQQFPQQAPMTNFSQYQNMKDMKRSNSGILKIQNKLGHSYQKNLDMSTLISHTQDQMGQPRQNTIAKNLSFQLNAQKFKSEDFDDKNQDDNSDKYSQAFGYNSSGSGLLIQQQPQINQHQSFLDNHPSFGKLSQSIDDSQNDDINLCQINYDASNNSERESFLNQTMRNAHNTQTVKNISTRSDSDNSHQIAHQITIQQYQSPESGQKLAMTQRIYLNNSMDCDYMMMSNSGRDTPPKFSTPGSKLNNSFHHFGSSQNLSNYIRINNEATASQQPQGPYHARNFSAEQQFYQSELMQQQLYAPQALNQSHLNHSMSIQSMQQLQNSTYYNYLSTSQDLNNISLYGQPISLNQQLSASNSSVDLQSQRLSLQNRNKKGNKNDQQKNHQQLKSSYKESYEPMSEETFMIDDDRIKNGIDMRTTIMIRNIPNKYKQKNLLDEINQNNKGKYDFVYLPIDFQNNANIGYGFVNFLNPLFILEFKEEFENRRWRKFQSQKKCELKYGRLQGIAQLNQHFQNSTVSNQVDVQVRPRVFDENMRKDWTKEIQRICNKYNINSQTFLNFKNNTNQQSLSTKPDVGSNMSVNSQQNIHNNSQFMINKPDKSQSVDVSQQFYMSQNYNKDTFEEHKQPPQ